MAHHPGMEILSTAINRVVEIVGSEGNQVKVVSGDWKPRQVVFMSEPLSSEAKKRITAELPQLVSYREERTPHNPADEGFVDREEDVAISFPIAGERRRWH